MIHKYENTYIYANIYMFACKDHSSLHARFPHLHPDLAEFIVQAQVWHNSNTIRAHNVLMGIPLPCRRLPQYVRNDQQIANHKQNLIIEIQQRAGPAGIIIPKPGVLSYLDKISRCLGQH